MKIHHSILCVVIVLIVTMAPWVKAQDWPQWRGPNQNGTSNQTGLPTEWSLEKNIVWKTSLPAWSGSTPIIVGDRIFVMSPTKTPAESQSESGDQENAGRESGARGGQESGQQDDESRAQDRRSRRRGRSGRRGGRGGRMGGPSSPGGKEIMLMCLSKNDGSLLWEKQVEANNRQFGKQNSSSPSPVTDGQHVWTLTGNGQLTAFDLDGNEQWSFNLQERYGEFGLGWGYASSPALHNGKLIIQVLHGRRTDDPSYVLALNAASGEELWKQERPTDAPNESPDAYTTPMILEHDGETLVVVSGGDYVTAHDFETGNEVWRSGGLNPGKAPNYRIVGSPLVTPDLVVASSRVRPIIAVRPGGTGDVTESHLKWEYRGQGGPDVPSLVTDGERLYMVNDRSGIVTCLDIKTGEVVWGPERVQDGTVSASPLLADGKIYITNEKATTTVLKAGPEFEKLATNDLDGSYTLSSIAVSGNQLFVRTGNALYCIAGSE